MSMRAGLAIAIGLMAIGGATAAPPEGVRAIDGEWVFVEDRTEGRDPEKQGPNTGPRIRIRVEDNAVVLVRNDGDIRMAFDGGATDIVRQFGTSRYRGEWKDGAYVYQSVSIRDGAEAPKGRIRWTMRPTAEGLLVSVALDPPTGSESLCLFRHPQDIAMPTPAKAAIADVAWLAGAWVGTRGAASIEERWAPPLGGAMLATSRTVSRGKMTAFEFLRVVERDGGLVYIAQPNGARATEFVSTEVSATRAVFANPRHDSPQRIVYELGADGRLSASIGFTKGGRPQRFEFTREGK